MCRIFAAQAPADYRQINRSVRIAGHSTSIQLEAVDVLTGGASDVLKLFEGKARLAVA